MLSVLVAYHLVELPKSFVIGITGVTSGCLMYILKSFYKEPRPYYVADIKPFSCRLEHGNPSGHALLAAALYNVLGEMFIR